MMMDTLKQKGGADCELLAIAISTAIAFGVDRTSLEYNQKETRAHLLNVSMIKFMSLFPTLTS